MNLKEKSIIGTFWAFAENLGTKVVSILVFFILASILGPESFGLIALSTAFLGFTGMLTEQGLVVAIVQKKDLDPEHLDSAFWGNVGIGSLFFLLSILCAPFIAQFYNEPELEPIVMVMALSFLTQAFSKVQEALLQRELNLKALAKRKLISIMGGAVVGLTMAFTGFGVWSLVMQGITFGILQAIILWRESTWRPRLTFSKRHYIELFSFGSKMMAANFVHFINDYFIDLLIGYFLGTTALGYYTIANKVYRTLKELLTNTLSRVTLPLFSKLQNEKERLFSVLMKVTQYAAYIAFPCFGVLILAGPEVFPYFFGEKWNESILVLQLFCVAGIVLTPTMFMDDIFISTGNPHISLKMHAIGSGLNLVLFLLLMGYGVAAIALAHLATSLVMLIIMYLGLRKILRVDFGLYVKTLFRPFLSMVLTLTLFYAVFQGLDFPLLLRLTLAGSIAALAYLAMISVASPEMLQTVRSFITLRNKKSEQML